MNKYKIRSRFEDITLNTDQLSAGCKTVLNVLYFPDKVFFKKNVEIMFWKYYMVSKRDMYIVNMQ